MSNKYFWKLKRAKTVIIKNVFISFIIPFFPKLPTFSPLSFTSSQNFHYLCTRTPPKQGLSEGERCDFCG